MKKTTHFILFLSLMFSLNGFAQQVEAFPLTPEWLGKIEQILPKTSGATTGEKQKLLIFSLHTGFEHWIIPHTESVIQLIAEKSGNYEVVTSKDIKVFERDRLSHFDVIVLNNNCSDRAKRDLFWDALKDDKSLDEGQRIKKAKKLEANLLKHIKKGNGLVVLHGSIVMQNNSKKFGQMVGGSFDYHPKQQQIHLKLADSEHPLVQCFDSSGFKHVDEPYFFNKAYFDYNFRPLLYMETDMLEGLKQAVPDKIKYVSWIKRHGKGRVFYSSPSHNAQSYENPELLHFLLNGLQYAAGHIDCDDSPMQ